MQGLSLFQGQGRTVYVLEKDDERIIVQFCVDNDILCQKLRLASENAWPDRTLMYRGSVMFLEIKRRGEKPTPLQMYTLNQLRKRDFLAIWSDDLEHIKRVILTWKEYVDDSRRSVV